MGRVVRARYCLVHYAGVAEVAGAEGDGAIAVSGIAGLTTEGELALDGGGGELGENL